MTLPEDEQLLIASLIDAGGEPALNFEVATRIFGFTEPVIYFEHKDRKQRKNPQIGFRAAPKTKHYWHGEYGTVFDINGNPILDREGHTRPGNALLKLPNFFSSELSRHVLLMEMKERGYEFALACTAGRWGASFHGTLAPVEVRLLDSATSEEAIVRAALRTLGVK